MSVKVDRVDCYADEVSFHYQNLAYSSYNKRKQTRTVGWQMMTRATPAEAREFAAAIIAVADAVEKEGGK